MKLTWQKLLPIIGLILFIYIISRLDFLKFWQVIREADYQFFLFLPFTVVLILYLQTLKWQILLKSQTIKVSLLDLFKIHLIGNYYALITPSRLGYFTKIAYLQNYLKGSTPKISSSVIIDRILDIFILILLALVGSLLLLGSYPNIFTSLLIVGLIFVILVLLFYSPKRLKFFTPLLKKIIPEKFRNKLKNGFNEFYKVSPDKKNLLVPIFLTFLTWVVIYSQAYLIALALNININYWHFVILLPISTVASLLPITISGLGTREAALILIFFNYNISSESIVAMSLIGFVLVYYLPSFIGGFLSFKIFLKKD